MSKTERSARGRHLIQHEVAPLPLAEEFSVQLLLQGVALEDAVARQHDVEGKALTAPLFPIFLFYGLKVDVRVGVAVLWALAKLPPKEILTKLAQETISGVQLAA